MQGKIIEVKKGIVKVESDGIIYVSSTKPFFGSVQANKLCVGDIVLIDDSSYYVIDVLEKASNCLH